jgi:hypothetical protein
MFSARKRWVTVALATLGLAAVAGCGHSASDEPVTAAGLQAAVTATAPSGLRLDAADSYARLSDVCKKTWTVTSWGANLASASRTITSAFGVSAAQLSVQRVDVRNVKGTAGEASVTLVVKSTGKPLSSTQTWSLYVYEHGKWRRSSCAKVPSVTAAP